MAESEYEHGLVYGATVRFFDSAALRCARAGRHWQGKPDGACMACGCHWRPSCKRLCRAAARRLRRRALVMWDRGKPARVLIVKKPGEPEAGDDTPAVLWWPFVPAAANALTRPPSSSAAAKLHEIALWLKMRGIQVGQGTVAALELCQQRP